MLAHAAASCWVQDSDLGLLGYSSVITFVISGLWNYTLTMRAFTDPGQTQVVEASTEVRLNQKIWVELKTDGLDGDLISVVTDACWATSQESENGSLRYDLITNGWDAPRDACPGPSSGLLVKPFPVCEQVWEPR